MHGSGKYPYLPARKVIWFVPTTFHLPPKMFHFELRMEAMEPSIGKTSENDGWVHHSQ